MLGKRRAERLEDLACFVPWVFEMTVTVVYFVIELLESKAKVKSEV